jgi:hypothetical protein
MQFFDFSGHRGEPYVEKLADLIMVSESGR